MTHTHFFNDPIKYEIDYYFEARIVNSNTTDPHPQLNVVT